MDRHSTMEVDGENSSRPTSSPLMRSRFNHLSGGLVNGAADQNGRCNSGDMTITAGIVSRSPAACRRGHPGFAGASVTTVIREGSDPDETISTAVLRPEDGCSDGARIRPHYQNQPAGCNGDVLGVVTIGEVRHTDHAGPTGPQEQVQQQQPQRPMPNFGGCRPSIPEIPVIPEPPRPQNFQIHVKNFDGKTYTFTVESATRVEKLMNMIHERLGVPPDQQVLQYAGQNLQKGKSLRDYNIQNGSTIFLTGRLRGG